VVVLTAVVLEVAVAVPFLVIPPSRLRGVPGPLLIVICISGAFLVGPRLGALLAVVGVALGVGDARAQRGGPGRAGGATERGGIAAPDLAGQRPAGQEPRRAVARAHAVRLRASISSHFPILERPRMLRFCATS